MQLTGFDGNTALISGASGGIGCALVKLLSAAGCQVFATDLHAADLEPLSLLANVHCIELDVRDATAVNALVARIEKNHGPIGIGVNVAGICRTGLATLLTEGDWQDLMDINAGGVFHLSSALARAMITRGCGNIVTVSSNAAGIPRHGMAAYAASKAAATMFTRSLGLELAPHGIRCNVVAPGSTLTPMQTALWDGPDAEAAVIAGTPQRFKTGIPLKKLAQPEDIAQAVMFLLSDQAGHITLESLYVDGGATLVG